MISSTLTCIVIGSALISFAWSLFREKQGKSDAGFMFFILWGTIASILLSPVLLIIGFLNFGFIYEGYTPNYTKLWIIFFLINAIPIIITLICSIALCRKHEGGGWKNWIPLIIIVFLDLLYAIWALIG